MDDQSTIDVRKVFISCCLTSSSYKLNVFMLLPSSLMFSATANGSLFSFWLEEQPFCRLYYLLNLMLRLFLSYISCSSKFSLRIEAFKAIMYFTGVFLS